MKKVLFLFLLIPFFASAQQRMSGPFEFTGTVQLDAAVTCTNSLQTPSFIFVDGNQASGYVMKSDANGAASWVAPALVYKRGNSGAPTTFTPIVYTKTLTTSGGSGKASDTLTTNGGSTGTAIFTTITDIQVTALSADTTLPYSANVFSIGSGNKTIVVRAASGSTPAATGTTVYMTIRGY